MHVMLHTDNFKPGSVQCMYGMVNVLCYLHHPERAVHTHANKYWRLHTRLINVTPGDLPILLIFLEFKTYDKKHTIFLSNKRL